MEMVRVEMYTDLKTVTKSERLRDGDRFGRVTEMKFGKIASWSRIVNSSFRPMSKAHSLKGESLRSLEADPADSKISP